ncbi:MAG: polysaccharide deacetylase family protein [Terriglobales bacterium]
MSPSGWKQPAKRLLAKGDDWLAAAGLLVMPNRPGLLIFAFHGLFESPDEIALHLADPQQAITINMFRSFVENLVQSGHQFVSPSRVLAGLDPAGTYAMITFDDGYASNRRALAAMEEFQAPAVFSISTNHVRTGKPFWWDVLYREAGKRGWEDKLLNDTRSSLKRLRTCEIEQRLVADFGPAAFHTVSDTDRPFTPQELAEFARHPLVEIGNHTCDHAILTNYPISEIGSEIGEAQDWLREITGQTPQTIAYPNGNVSRPILHAVRDAGLPLGLTGQPGRNHIAGADASTNALLLKRHTLWGFAGIEAQCRVARSPLSLQTAAAALRSNVSGSL